MQINNIFILAEPFNHLTTIDINEADIYTLDTFSDCIVRQEAAEMPFFLALTKDENGTIAAFNGFSFVHSYYDLRDHRSPITRARFVQAIVYKIDNLKDRIFQYFGDIFALYENKGAITFIKACNLDLKVKKRGKKRYLLATWYEMGTICDKDRNQKAQTLIKKNHDQYLFWLKKSVKDQYYLAHHLLAFNYEHGLGVEKSEERAFKHALKAAELVLNHQIFASSIYLTLSRLYIWGIGVQKDEKRSHPYFKKGKALLDKEDSDLSTNPHMNKIFEYFCNWAL